MHVQALLDLCCVATQQLHLDLQLPGVVTQCLSRLVAVDFSFRSTVFTVLMYYRRKNGVCDQCGGVVYGVGLRVIRSIRHTHFSVKNLPFIFVVCSPPCWSSVRGRENWT